jgi:transcription antitermination protein NusB
MSVHDAPLNSNNSSEDTQSEFSRFGEHEIIPCDTLSQRDQRTVIFHLLYALDSFDYEVSFSLVVDSFCRGFLCEIDPQGPLYKKAEAIAEQRNELDEHIKPLLHNWRFDRIGVCTRLILRIALWEFLQNNLDTSVIINEAVELAKCFAESDAHKFVNGLLDEWAKKNRPEPIQE